MKGYFSILFFIVSFGIATAEVKTCVDISVNLSRGAESSSVLKLQTFLAEKGYLKARPNGYYGLGTVAAVKLFQKSVGITQTGASYTLTRAAIKRESCTATSTKATTHGIQSGIQSTASTSPVVSQSLHASQAIKGVAPVVNSLLPQGMFVATTSNATTTPTEVPRPRITLIKAMTFITGGQMTSPLVISGSGFSSSSNEIILTLQGTNRAFSLGTYTSATGTMIVATSGIPVMTIPCGTGCVEKIPVGNYDVTVKNKGGESNSGFISIKGFTSSTKTATEGTPIIQKISNVKIGTLSFSSSIPVVLQDITVIPASVNYGTTTGIIPSSISNITLKDELTGQTRASSQVFATSTGELYENQSKIFTIYADIDAKVSGAISIEAVITLKDYIAKNAIKVYPAAFLVTISDQNR